MRLNQVTVGTVDVGRAERFYTLLGLHLIVRDEHYLRFECPEGASTFSVERMEREGAGDGVTVYFECDDLDAECARLAQAGIALDQEPRDMPWLWREARLRDPDGHPICLYRAGHNRTHPPWRLG